ARQSDELLPRDHIIVPLRATTLRAAFSELVERLASLGLVHDPDAVERGLNGPRARDIVAVAPDVVLPHLRTDAVDTLQVALGLAPRGLDARELGLDTPSRVVALILAPTPAATLYLQTAAA